MLGVCIVHDDANEDLPVDGLCHVPSASGRWIRNSKTIRNALVTVAAVDGRCDERGCQSVARRVPRNVDGLVNVDGRVLGGRAERYDW